jgi:acetyl esterase
VRSGALAPRHREWRVIRDTLVASPLAETRPHSGGFSVLKGRRRMPMNPALSRLIAEKLAHPRPPQWEMPLADVRKAFRDLWTPALTGDPPAIARREDATVPATAVPVRIYAQEPNRPAMLYFHGGGYVKGGIDESDAFCRTLARLSRHVVVSVDYRLAPEHPFPAALDDAVAATLWACTRPGDLGAAPGPVVVCGESAGGNLAAVVCLRARSEPRIAISRQVLLQPVIDFTLSFPSTALRPDECLVPRDDLAWYYRTYYGNERDFRNPLVSPLYAGDLAGLPPALVIAAEYDTLRDEDEAYAKRLRAAGVAAEYRCYPGMVHGFLQMGGLVAEARSAVEEIAQFLNRTA